MDILEKADKLVTDAAATSVTATSPVDAEQQAVDSKDATKAYSDRLNADRAKMRQEVENEMAQSMGYTTWDEYRAAQRKKVITDAGLEPEQVEPVVSKLLASDPAIIAARELKAAQEKVASDEANKSELLALNSTYGTEFKSMDELDDATKVLIEKGVPLVKAYGIEHLDDVVKTREQVIPSKGHLVSVVGSGKSSTPKVVTPKQMEVFRLFNPDASDEQIIAYLSK